LKIKVVISPAFSKGNLDGDDFRDAPNFREKDILHLTTFVDAVEAGTPLQGKNKPSWLNDDFEEIQYTESYKEDNYWHYHGVEKSDTRKVNAFTYDLGINLNGLQPLR